MRWLPKAAAPSKLHLNLEGRFPRWSGFPGVFFGQRTPAGLVILHPRVFSERYPLASAVPSPSPEALQIPTPSQVLCSVQGPRSKSCQMSLGNLEGRAALDDLGAWERNEKLALHFKPVLNSQAPSIHSSASILVPLRTLRVSVRNLPGRVGLIQVTRGSSWWGQNPPLISGN